MTDIAVEEEDIVWLEVSVTVEQVDDTVTTREFPDVQDDVGEPD